MDPLLTRLTAAAAPLLGLLLIGTSPLAAQEDCALVFAAMDKVMTTPTHISSTTTVAGKPEVTEMLYSGEAAFMKEKGKWIRQPISVKQIGTQEQEGRARKRNSCKELKDDVVDGEAAVVYTTRSEGPGERSDGQITISKRSGLPLRNEIDMERGGKPGKTHYSVRYDYKKIVVPKD